MSQTLDIHVRVIALQAVALSAARAQIIEDRAALHECSVSTVDDGAQVVDEDSQAALTRYDAVLTMIDRALNASVGL